jgi:esterase FrsA
LAKRSIPMRWCNAAEATAAIERLPGIDGESWGTLWGEVAAGFERTAEEAEARGDLKAADEARFQAYTFYYIGRYPCPNHPKKEECARKAREQFIAASRAFDPPLEKCTIPFAGRKGEGKEIVVYLRKPKGIARPPVLVNWGGSDGYKEERYLNGNAILAAGMATLVLDSPGTGEAPVYASLDAERLFVTVLEWVKQRTDLDATRMAILGSSAGGYWATKLAHTHKELFKAAVNWGGGIHYRYQRDWLEKSRYAESALLGTDEQRPRTCNLKTYEEYIDFAPKLSLLDQGVLDRPCAPLLLVNGKDDKQTPIQDFYLLLEHGEPKTMRVFPGGHMGQTPQTLPTIIKWISDQLGVAARS